MKIVIAHRRAPYCNHETKYEESTWGALPLMLQLNAIGESVIFNPWQGRVRNHAHIIQIYEETEEGGRRYFFKAEGYGNIHLSQELRQILKVAPEDEVVP